MQAKPDEPTAMPSAKSADSTGRKPLPDESWWYNLKTNEVEYGLLSAAVYRVGPFDTRVEAEQALELVKARSAAWAKQDEEDR